MRDRGHDRRAFANEAFLAEVQTAVDRALADRASLKKNGHSWGDYVKKVVTPERIILVTLTIVSFVFNVGGELRDAKRDLKAATEQAEAASHRAETASEQAQAASSAIGATRHELEAFITELKAQKESQQALSMQVRDRISLSITRAEWKQVMDQQILPRLLRIEQRLGTNP